MGRHYTQIDLEEHCRIFTMKEQGVSHTLKRRTSHEKAVVALARKIWQLFCTAPLRIFYRFGCHVLLALQQARSAFR